MASARWHILAMLSAKTESTYVRPAPPLTAQQAAAILDLYVTQRQPWLVTAKRLRLSPSQVRSFILDQGVMRPRGGGGNSRKIFPTLLNQLKGELPTTRNYVLAIKYGVTNERIRQIRAELGCVAGKVVAHKLVQRIRRKRQAQAALARQHRLAAKQAFIERLSQCWKSGMSARDSAAAENLPLHHIAGQIMYGRVLFPDKFPYACARGGWVRPRRPYRPHGPQSAAARAAHQQRLRAYWEHQLPALNQLSQQWKAGRPVRAIAAELGIAPDTVWRRIFRARKWYPDKFPLRHTRRALAAAS